MNKLKMIGETASSVLFVIVAGIISGVGMLLEALPFLLLVFGIATLLDWLFG